MVTTHFLMVKFDHSFKKNFDETGIWKFCGQHSYHNLSSFTKWNQKNKNFRNRYHASEKSEFQPQKEKWWNEQEKPHQKLPGNSARVLVIKILISCKVGLWYDVKSSCTRFLNLLMGKMKFQSKPYLFFYFIVAKFHVKTVVKMVDIILSFF